MDVFGSKTLLRFSVMQGSGSRVSEMLTFLRLLRLLAWLVWLDPGLGLAEEGLGLIEDGFGLIENGLKVDSFYFFGLLACLP